MQPPVILFYTVPENAQFPSSATVPLDAPWIQPRHPDVCGYIRELRLRPNYRLSWPAADTTVDEAWVVDQVTEITNHLDGLHTFELDGAVSGRPLMDGSKGLARGILKFQVGGPDADLDVAR
ncbi:hypothetical protein FB451DRAFT_1194741 [Mycena latifolia]|nr:hypothetical protein FB451DRAFT_1194741 [Mycena latifolia]